MNLHDGRVRTLHQHTIGGCSKDRIDRHRVVEMSRTPDARGHKVASAPNALVRPRNLERYDVNLISSCTALTSASPSGGNSKTLGHAILAERAAHQDCASFYLSPFFSTTSFQSTPASAPSNTYISVSLASNSNIVCGPTTITELPLISMEALINVLEGHPNEVNRLTRRDYSLILSI